MRDGGQVGAERIRQVAFRMRQGVDGRVGHEQSPPSLEMRDGGQVGAERTLRLAFRVREGVLGRRMRQGGVMGVNGGRGLWLAGKPSVTQNVGQRGWRWRENPPARVSSEGGGCGWQENPPSLET